MSCRMFTQRKMDASMSKSLSQPYFAFDNNLVSSNNNTDNKAEPILDLI